MTKAKENIIRALRILWMRYQIGKIRSRPNRMSDQELEKLADRLLDKLNELQKKERG